MDYRYFYQNDFRGGINQNESTTQPNQIADGRNVWAPNGKLEQRPGYFGVYFFRPTASGLTTGSASLFLENSATGTVTQWVAGAIGADYRQAQTTSLIGDIYYIKDLSLGTVFDTISIQAASGGGQQNTAVTKFSLQYWNGTIWKSIYSTKTYSVSASFTEYALFANSAAGYITFVPPTDWQTINFQGSTRYVIRLVLLNADVSAGTVPLGFNPSTGTILDSFIFQANFLTNTRTINLQINGSTGVYLINTASLSPNGFRFSSSTRVDNTSAVQNGIQYAVIPEFGEVYLSAGYRVFITKANPTTNDLIDARIEDRQEYVGTISGIRAPYHPDLVAQLREWPRAKFFLWFQNHLFAANFEDNKTQFSWSAPTDPTLIGYRVWPIESTDFLTEDDNSEITGLVTLNEHIIVFKENSIWRVVYVGTNDIGLNLYDPVKVTSGIGCIAPNSIKKTPFGLVFLSQDGLYLFDGNQAKKISSPIDSVVETLNFPTSEKFVATVWEDRNVYMLAVAASGSSINNLVLVWDYKHNAWWLWDNMEVCQWIVQKQGNSKQQVIFSDSSNYYYQLGGGDDNGAATDAWIKLHRMPNNTAMTSSFREIRVLATNDTDSLNITPICEDRQETTSYALRFDSAAETSWSEAVDGASFSTRKRREAKLPIRKTGDWLQVKIQNSTKNQQLKLNAVSVGAKVLARR
jgi:hypothetical protein